MEEKIQENQVEQPSLEQTPVAVPGKKTKPPTIAILLIVILLIGAGLVYAGMQLAKRQTSTSIPTSVVQPTSAVVIPTTSTSAETTNWKTYTTKTFSVKYPNIWDEPQSFLQSTRTEYVFNPSGLGIVEGSYYDQSTGRTRTYEEEVALGEKNAQDKTDIKVDGLSAVKFLYSSPKSKEGVIFSSKEGLIYWISMDISSPQDVILFDQILSTFKFLE